MYAGFILLNTGIGITLHSVYSLIWAGLIIIIQYVGAIREERRLMGWSEKEYEDYGTRVNRDKGE